ncbi:putative reverse transcriptase domain-containing protein [Tanacetum coccineum]|uniref:Reverse transcriptase domain-containing protein n=1 Tax=Tanacetum coccineum TaxID=301880 RepID=A0ABQ5G9V2_9ASTR
MDDPNMTMEEYIKFEEEKARRHGRVFNWQTATYRKIRVDYDLYDLRYMEAEFPAIVINDAVAPQDELQCKSQVSTPVNDEIDFRISFDESDDEDYTIIYDKNLFSYKMISVNDLKTDSENDYEKVMPLIPSPKPAISCFDDLDFFEDFENEFPAIVYNDAQITLLYKLRQTTVPFPSHLDNHYSEEEEGNYGPKFTKAYGASHINNIIPRKEKDPGSFTLPCFINDVCFENALVDLGDSVSVMPLSTYLNLGLGEVELADRTVKYPKGIAKNVLVEIGKFTFPVDFIILDMPEVIKVPLILGRPFLSTARGKIDVYKRKITLRVGEEKIIFKSIKPASSLIKRVYMLSLRERMELDLEARLMGETLLLNRLVDPFLEDYIKLNDLNEPFELRRNQGDDLMPTIEEGEVIEEFRTRNEDLDIGIDDYPSYCDDDKKIHIDCAHNLKFSCMIGFEYTYANFFPLLYVNVMSKKFHNSIMKDKMVYKGNNVVKALMNIPIFVGTFSVMTNFAVLEDMDAYRDEGMGEVILDKPFLREVGIKTKWFEGIITLYKSDDEVTYQMVRSHPRFKRHTNEKCNKIPPLLKVSKKDEKNGISHAYQKHKGFYKGFLNLGPDYIRNAKTEEWLTRGHISMHEME